MVSHPIRQALVLAHATAGGRPAAALRTGGLPHLARVLLTLKRRDVTRFWILVAGAGQRAVLEAIVAEDPRLASLDVRFVEGPAGADTGALLASARDHLRGDFLLVEADRVFSLDLLDALLVAPLDGITLAVAAGDHPNVDGPALPLAVHGDRLARVEPGAVPQPIVRSAGIAACDDTVLELAAAFAGRPDPLQEILAHLAALRCARVVRVGPRGFSIRLRGAADRRRADALLLDALRKPEVDGPIARYLNRNVSLAVTRRLMNVAVSPNAITVFNLLIAVAAGVTAGLASPAHPALLAVGAVLWQVASMLDGVDGELARLTFRTSKTGEWLDTLSDDIGRVVFFLGVGYGTANVFSAPLYWHLMLGTVAIQVVLNLFAYRKLLEIGAGSHLALAWTDDREDGGPKSPLARFFARIEFMGRRDYYIFTFMVVTLLGFVKLAIVCTFLTTLIILGHDVFRPRKPRDARVLRPILLRDE